MSLGLIESTNLENIGQALRAQLGETRIEQQYTEVPLLTIFKTPNIRTLDDYNANWGAYETDYDSDPVEFPGATSLRLKVNYPQHDSDLSVGVYTTTTWKTLWKGNSSNTGITEVTVEYNNEPVYLSCKTWRKLYGVFGCYVEITPLDADGNPMTGLGYADVEVENTFLPSQMARFVEEIGLRNDAYFNGTLAEFVNHRITALPFEFLNGDQTCAKVHCENVTQLTNFMSAYSYGAYGMTGNKVQELILPNADINLDNNNSNYFCQSCTTLKKIDIKSLGSRIYFGNSCTNLETVIIRSTTMCPVTVNILSSTKISNGAGYIYVPRALVESYKAADRWNMYSSLFRAIEDYPDICG